MRILGVIPVRYNSSRFPGKPLANILGKSMIQRVYEKSSLCNNLNKIIVATDDERIAFHVKSFGGNVIMTSKNHQSGTDRCGEALEKIKKEFDIIVNIQGDEPFIKPCQINEVISLFKSKNVTIGTLSKEIEDYCSMINKNTVKVFFDDKNYANSFIREHKISKEEFNKNTFYKHIGIYAFKASTLKKITTLSSTKNELKLNLEQLRWLDNKLKIKVGITEIESISVDTAEDIQKIEEFHLKNS
tara:strand:- start:784 stop:1515 length:732 start_codon:yes stop_codon:yes gene_type:complete